jgi:polyphenol oxidase
LGKEITTSWMNQTHSTDVAIIDSLESAKAITDADAQITSMPNIALAVMTADCLPILLTVDDGSIVACIHGGWRGLSGGIVHNTISAMMVEPNRIHAWLGPCIGPKKFEVGDMVRSEFVEQNEEFSLFFHPIKNKTKYMADLQSIAIFQLKQQGVKNIIRDTSCTYCDSKRFFSYRRDGTTGRTAGFIWR